MALDKVVLSNLFKTKLENIFMWPTYDAAELKKFTDAMAEAVVEHVQGSAELDGATLDDNTISGTVSGTGDPVTGIVVDDKVSGGIK